MVHDYINWKKFWEENAPDGATHYYDLDYPDMQGFTKVQDNILLYWDSRSGWDTWDTTSFNTVFNFLISKEDIFKEASETDDSSDNNSWYDYEKGEAVEFPPSGTTCLVHTGREWVEVFVVGLDSQNQCVVDSVGSGIWPAPLCVCFKPLSSKEELEKEEFLKEVREKLDTLQSSTKSGIAEWLWDQGYRKEK